MNRTWRREGGGREGRERGGREREGGKHDMTCHDFTYSSYSITNSDTRTRQNLNYMYDTYYMYFQQVVTKLEGNVHACTCNYIIIQVSEIEVCCRVEVHISIQRTMKLARVV